MARFSCKIRLVKYKPDMSGYPGVMNAGAVQGILKSKAAAVNSAASGSAKPGADYETYNFQGILAKGYVVSTANYEAMIDEFYHKTLTKAAHAAGGGS